MVSGRLRHGILLVIVGGGLMIGCIPAEPAEPTATPILPPDALAGPTLPSSWTPDSSPTPTHTATPRATPTATPTPSPLPSPTVGAGWTQYIISEGNLVLRLPPTWLPLPLEGQDPAAVLGQVGQDDPALAASLRHGLPDETLAQARFLAFDSAAALRRAPFVSTLRVAVAGTGDFEAAASAREEAVAADPLLALVADWPLNVGFEARNGWLVRYESAFPPGAPTVTTSHTQIFVDNGQNEVVVFTFSTERTLAQGYERLFELVLDGVHFTIEDTGDE